MLIQSGAFWMGSDPTPPRKTPCTAATCATSGSSATRWPAAIGATRRPDPPARGALHRRPRLRGATPPGRSPGPAPATTASGAADVCPPRPSGRRPPAGSIPAAVRGGTSRRTPGPGSSGAPATRPSAATSGRSAPGATGVQDLLGNLREWTASAYRPHPYHANDGRDRAAPDADRVVRGASHDDPPDALRVTIRRHSSYDGGARWAGPRPPAHRLSPRHLGGPGRTMTS